MLRQSRLWRIKGYTVYFAGRNPALGKWTTIWKFGKVDQPGRTITWNIGPVKVWQGHGKARPWGAG